MHIIVLAAGRGTRMKSPLLKVMHPLAGTTLLGHVLKTSRELSPHSLTVVGSSDLFSNKEFLKEDGVSNALQQQPLGSGDAARCGMASFSPLNDNELVLILNGDVPLLKSETLKTMIDSFTDGIVVGTFQTDNPFGYGRCLLNAQNKLMKIVEEKDATDQERKITLCNGGIILGSFGLLKRCLEKITSQNAQGEFYLTDVIEHACSFSNVCHTFLIDTTELLGVNTQADLVAINDLFQQQKRESALLKGALLQDPKTVYFSHDTIIESGCLVEPFVYFGPKVHLKSQAVVRSFSHIEETTLHEKSVVGPFARLRGGCDIGQRAEVGNFVEVKNTSFGHHSKAKHLSYLGDTTLGEKVNVGAGTITCNYDGTKKSKTTLKDGSFIGSNTTLIAPLTVEEDAYVAAGSVITKDVPKQSLAIARSEQVHKNNWVKKGENN